MKPRSIRNVFPAVRDDIADLVTYRALPTQYVDMIDPFLFLNHHGPQTYPAPNRGLPFGPHPHRGFETVTFILEGDIAHRDSGGHESIIDAGGVQWMTAGRGLVHAEVSSDRFKARGGPLEILQLWVNLPARLKMTQPHYVGLQRADLPVAEADQGRVKVQLTAGAWDGTQGPVQPLTDIAVMTAELQSAGRFERAIPTAHNVFFYVVRGAVEIDGRVVPHRHLVEFDRDGDAIAARAVENALVLLCHAMPFGEPVVAHGPFVMNTKEEIHQAIRDYQAGLFGPEAS